MLSVSIHVTMLRVLSLPNEWSTVSLSRVDHGEAALSKKGDRSVKSDLQFAIRLRGLHGINITQEIPAKQEPHHQSEATADIVGVKERLG